MKGFVSFPQPVMRRQGARQAGEVRRPLHAGALFFDSQTPAEQNHIVGAFRFELTKVGVQAIRERVVSMLANVDDELAAGRRRRPRHRRCRRRSRASSRRRPSPRSTRSPALSLFARPGDGGMRGRKVALLVADGIDGDVAARGARSAGRRRARCRASSACGSAASQPATGDAIHVEVTLETAPSVIWDAMVLPAGDDGAGAATARRSSSSRTSTATASRSSVLGSRSVVAGGLPPAGRLARRQPRPRAGSRRRRRQRRAAFIAALGKHRVYERETDPPVI